MSADERDERDGREDRLRRARQAWLAQRAHGLAELLDRRPELSGVHDPADLVAESVRWSA